MITPTSNTTETSLPELDGPPPHTPLEAALAFGDPQTWHYCRKPDGTEDLLIQIAHPDLAAQEDGLIVCYAFEAGTLEAAQLRVEVWRLEKELATLRGAQAAAIAPAPGATL